MFTIVLKTLHSIVCGQPKASSGCPFHKKDAAPSLFTRIGGQEAINLAVDKFYEKVLKDPRVKDFFKKTDMKKQAQMQKDFITTVLGGPQVYKGKNMAEGHKHLKLSDKDFDVIVELLVQTLQELGVDGQVIKEVGVILESVRGPVTGKLTLFEKVGGQEALNLAVDLFYEKVLKDPRVRDFFKKTDMKKQAQLQKDFFTTALGGPKVYKGKDMKCAHDHLKISNLEFDVIVSLLVQTLQELGVDSQVIGEIGAVVETTRATIVNFPPAKASIYDRIGGAAAINVAVDNFYVKVLADKRVKHFFAKIDMKKQAQQQKDFLTTAFGGPQIYKGKDMREAHKNMKLTEVELNAIVELLAGTLKELGVDDGIIGEIAAIVDSIKDELLNRPLKQ